MGKFFKPGPLGNAADYTLTVPYILPDITDISVPAIGGVYLLYEDGKYYIGESGDMLARTNGHRMCVPSQRSTGMWNPAAVVLVQIDMSEPHYSPNEKAKRLIAERRFLAAALHMDCPISNKLTVSMRARIQAQFPPESVSLETTRLRAAADCLQAKAA